jgi:hypothetical protein
VSRGKTRSLGRAEPLAKPDRQRFDGHLALRHGGSHLDQLTGCREKGLAVELDEHDRGMGRDAPVPA